MGIIGDMDKGVSGHQGGVGLRGCLGSQWILSGGHSGYAAVGVTGGHSGYAAVGLRGCLGDHSRLCCCECTLEGLGSFGSCSEAVWGQHLVCTGFGGICGDGGAATFLVLICKGGSLESLLSCYP